MEVSFSFGEFVSVLKTLRTIAETSTFQITKNVLLRCGEKCELLATDVQRMQAKGCIETASIIEGGACLLPAKDILNSLDGSDLESEIIIKTDKKYIKINCDSLHLSFPSADLSEYPEFGEKESYKYKSKSFFDAKEFIEAAKKCFWSVSTDDTRAEFQGVSIGLSDDHLCDFVTTDGHSLTCSKCAFEGASIDKRLLIHGDCLKAVCGAPACEKIEVSILQNAPLPVKIDCGKISFMCNQIAGQFPDFSKIFPVESRCKRLNLASKDLLTALKRAKTLAPKSNMIALSSGKGYLNIYSQSDKGEFNTSMPANGDSFENIGLNCVYLIKCVSAMGCEDICIYSEDCDSPLMLKDGKQNGVTAIIMPMQL